MSRTTTRRILAALGAVALLAAARPAVGREPGKGAPSALACQEGTGDQGGASDPDG